jgi:P4 family phage/plasmid primase-like protien|tara:strand:- start:1076 stop:2743 length:1668 start_codon:yes stop_codon:yes gene_type:complete
MKGKKNSETQSEEQLHRKGLNTSGAGSLYRAFKEYINFPSFDVFVGGNSQYDDFQFNTLRKLLFSTLEPKQIESNIKEAIQWVNLWGFEKYSEAGFKRFAVKYWKRKDKEDILAGAVLKITSYSKNMKLLHQIQPFFYDKSKIYWLWDEEEFCWKMVDETDILVLIDKQLSFAGQLVTNTVKNNYMEAFKQVGRANTPQEAPKHWVQFKDQVFDLKTKKIFPAGPRYFVCNPIPYELGRISYTPTMDKLFEEWVGKEYVETLYEIIAYCCLVDYPIHMIFCFVGCGRNGKSKFQGLINKFLGARNITSSELDLLLENRFESAKLFKRLVCLLGETNFGVMKKTSLLKKLSGGDLIGFEFKNKTPFDSENYAKIVISSNSLPTSDDTSEGFYRRWLIINFPNSFPEGKDILATIPELEYCALAKKVTEILPDLLERGTFTNQGTIEERKKKYLMSSNPISIFLQKFAEVGSEYFIKTTDLYNAYCSYLRKIKIRVVSRKEFKTALNEEGYYDRNTTKKVDLVNDVSEGGWWIEGLKLNEESSQQLQQKQLTSHSAP